VGGLFAGVAWYGVGYLFARLVAGSSKYSAIYSSLAAAVLFIIWTNVGWLIILVGAHIARYTQYPHLLRRHLRGPGTGSTCDAALALDIMTAIGRAHYFDEPQRTLPDLTAPGYSGYAGPNGSSRRCGGRASSRRPATSPRPTCRPAPSRADPERGPRGG